jgi:hypothetical protein
MTYAARNATTGTGIASLKLDSDALGSHFLNDSARASARPPYNRAAMRFHGQPGIGARGRGALIDPTRVVPFAIPEVGDLHDLTGNALEIFAVGDAGSIVHGGMHGAAEIVPIIYLL